MVQNAIVKKLVGDGVAEVSLLRQMECGLHCDGACAGCGQKPPEEILALATNPIGAKPGDFVEVSPAVGGTYGPYILIFLLPPGGFFVFGMLVALAGRLSQEKKAPADPGCDHCPLAASCSKVRGEKEAEG